MSVHKHKTIADVAARSEPIKTITQNGFSIVRLCDPNKAIVSEPGQHCFLVRDSDNYELEITVEIDPKPAREVRWRSRYRIHSTSKYWIALAERHLADYLWENDDFPPDGNLVVNRLTPEDCDLARTWKPNGSRFDSPDARNLNYTRC